MISLLPVRGLRLSLSPGRGNFTVRLANITWLLTGVSFENPATTSQNRDVFLTMKFPRR